MSESRDGSGGHRPSGTDDPPRLAGVTHRFLALPTGLRMHVAEAGDRDAPMVLLLHGFPQHWWEWRKVIPPLAQRYHVVAPDLRGSGWTDAPSGGYTVGEMSADVLALLDAVGAGRVGLVAHDFSAFVGYRLSFDHGDRVAGFLCLGPHPYMRFDPHMLAGVPQLWFQPVVAAPGLGPRALRSDRLARHLLSATASPGAITEADMQIFVARLHAQGHPEAGSALYRELILPEMGRFMASGAYRGKRLTVPTVALMGGADVGVRPGMLDVHGDRADDLCGHLVDGAAHFVVDDRPDAVVTHALELFGRVL